MGHGRSRVPSFARTACLVVAGVLAASLIADAPALADRSDEDALRSARDQIRSVERELSGARSAASDAAQALAEADARLARLEEALNEAAAAVERQRHAVDDAAVRIADLEDEILAHEEIFAERAVELYKRGGGLAVAALLDADSLADAMDRSAYVAAVNSADKASLEQIVVMRTRVAAERERMEEELERLEEMEVELEAAHAEVAELRAHRALRAADARAEVQRLEADKHRLEEDSRRIERLIRQRQQEAARAARAAQARTQARSSPGRGTPSQVSRSGHIWPRCDVVTSEYGPRWGRMHHGIDINGNTGDPIYASKEGTVIFAGWQGGYGRLILVDHHDGLVTAYAHMSAFAVSGGTRVSQGQRLGSVGSTGNSTGPHLHYETRVNGRAVNPRQFLPSSC